MKKTLPIVLLCVLVPFSFVIGSWYNRRSLAKAESATGRKVLYYVDPMHPAYKSDKPGIAPDCGMQLEPVYADAGAPPSTAESGVPGTVNISAEQQQLIGLRIAPVERSSGSRTLRVLGRVAADETRVYRISAGLDGFVQAAFSNSVGTLVKKDEPLVSIAGADLRTAEQSFLYAATRAPENRNEVVYQTDWRNETAKLAVDKLRTLGFTEGQIKELGEKRQIPDTLKLLSPASGFVLARNVATGQRFEKGTELFRIADLSHVWILADIFENEARYFQPGREAKVTLSQQGKTFTARVSSVLPQFDPASRTMKLRLETENPGYVLRPDMFVDVELTVPAPTGLSIPADALLDSGLKKQVFLDQGNGYFEPREVETGVRFGDRVQILKGLSAGDRIVVSGTFLVDSESKLRLAAAGASPNAAAMHQHSEADGDAHEAMGHHQPAASQVNGALVKDPKCGMNVDPAKATAAGLRLDYEGTTYYFCSKGCRDDFQKSPRKYLAASGAGAAHD